MIFSFTLAIRSIWSDKLLQWNSHGLGFERVDCHHDGRSNSDGFGKKQFRRVQHIHSYCCHPIPLTTNLLHSDDWLCVLALVNKRKHFGINNSMFNKAYKIKRTSLNTLNYRIYTGCNRCGSGSNCQLEDISTGRTSESIKSWRRTTSQIQ